MSTRTSTEPQHMHGARSTGEKVHKSSKILHALLKKTCKTGVCLLKISDQDLPPPGLTSEKFGIFFFSRACMHYGQFEVELVRPKLLSASRSLISILGVA